MRYPTPYLGCGTFIFSAYHAGFHRCTRVTLHQLSSQVPFVVAPCKTCGVTLCSPVESSQHSCIQKSLPSPYPRRKSQGSSSSHSLPKKRGFSFKRTNLPEAVAGQIRKESSSPLPSNNSDIQTVSFSTKKAQIGSYNRWGTRRSPDVAAVRSAIRLSQKEGMRSGRGRTGIYYHIAP